LNLVLKSALVPGGKLASRNTLHPLLVYWWEAKHGTKTLHLVPGGHTE
jgi:hypothetical protein